MKYTYEEKAFALQNELDKKYRMHSKWVNSIIQEIGVYDANLVNKLNSNFEKSAGVPIKLLKSISNSRYYSKKAIQRRIKTPIQEGKAAFCTFTFRDDVLNTTNEDTRRQYVRRFCSSISTKYVANLDYGEQFGREHYHALIVLEEGLLPEEWPHGWSLVQPINFTGLDDNLIAKYMTKLTNHSLKLSGTRKRIIYSRSNRVK